MERGGRGEMGEWEGGGMRDKEKERRIKGNSWT